MKNYVRKEIDEYGSIYFYNNKGQYHRIDGPAIELPYGTKKWYLNGKPHRENGPAIEYKTEYKSFYINGKYLSQEEFLYFLKYKETYKYNL